MLLSSGFGLILSLLVVGCSEEKVKLSGRREPLLVSEMHAIETENLDSTPVIVGQQLLMNSSYPQPHFNVTHCHDPLKFSLTPSIMWSSNLDYESHMFFKAIAAPVVAEGRVFCMDAGGLVYALDGTTGKRLWSMSTTIKGKDGQIGGAIAHDQGKLIVTSSFAECFCLDAKSGKILWRLKLPAPSKGDGISIYQGKAFILCQNGSLQVVNISSGEILWAHSGVFVESTLIGSASVAIADDTVFVAYPFGEIFALRSDTGYVKWDANFQKYFTMSAAKAFSHPRACPVVYDGIVYFIAANGQTVAYETKTGYPIWNNNYGGIQTPILSGNSMFLLNANGELLCLNNKTGKLRWSRKLSLDNSGKISEWYGQILVKDHILVISQEGDLFFVSIHDGKVKKIKRIVEGKVVANPVIANAILYLLLENGGVAAYR
jgi:outer membrane protein assembly factor BamB